MKSASPVGSFLRFFTVFVLFLGLSLSITFGVNSYTSYRDAQQAAAAAKALLLEQHFDAP